MAMLDEKRVVRSVQLSWNASFGLGASVLMVPTSSPVKFPKRTGQSSDLIGSLQSILLEDESAIPD